MFISIEILQLAFSFSAFLIAIFALIEVKAMQRSTHNIQILDPFTKELQNMNASKATSKPAKEYDNL